MHMSQGSWCSCVLDCQPHTAWEKDVLCWTRNLLLHTQKGHAGCSYTTANNHNIIGDRCLKVPSLYTDLLPKNYGYCTSTAVPDPDNKAVTARLGELII